jgi:hypothetical protein
MKRLDMLPAFQCDALLLTQTKIKALEKGRQMPKTEDGPRIFSLHKYVSFFSIHADIPIFSLVK